VVGCGQTSATWLPSTMRLPPSTRPSGSRERRSSAFIREDKGLPNFPTGQAPTPANRNGAIMAVLAANQSKSCVNPIPSRARDAEPLGTFRRGQKCSQRLPGNSLHSLRSVLQRILGRSAWLRLQSNCFSAGVPMSQMAGPANGIGAVRSDRGRPVADGNGPSEILKHTSLSPSVRT